MLRLALVAALLLATRHAQAVRQRSSRDWSSMTDEDWDRIEEELEDPEDKAEREEANRRQEEKFQRQKMASQVQFDMDAFQNAKTEEERQKILKAASANKPEQGKGMVMGHVFVTVAFDGCCPSDRKAVNALGRKWSSLLTSTGMGAGFSVWKDNQLAFQTQHEDHVKEITDFMMLQPECAIVRHDLVDTYGPAATAKFREEHERAIAEREKAKEEKIRKNREDVERQKARAEAKKRKKKKKKRALPADKGEL